MKCSPALMKYTGYLHIIALVVAIYGTYHQIESVKSGEAYSPYLAVALTAIGRYTWAISSRKCFKRSSQSDPLLQLCGDFYAP